ncbi:MAG: Lrp/AsnC family transcriptional regulator [Mycobacteriales bacterium]
MSQSHWRRSVSSLRQFDGVDRTLIEALRANGRATSAELARQVRLPAPAVHERVGKLDAAGVITGYHATVDPGCIRAGAPRSVRVTGPSGGAEGIPPGGHSRSRVWRRGSGGGRQGEGLRRSTPKWGEVPAGRVGSGGSAHPAPSRPGRPCEGNRRPGAGMARRALAVVGQPGPAPAARPPSGPLGRARGPG